MKTFVMLPCIYCGSGEHPTATCPVLVFNADLDVRLAGGGDRTVERLLREVEMRVY